MKIKVLIADDNSFIRGGMKIILTSFDDFEVAATVSDGVQAVRYCLQEDIDIALLDVRMPNMSGVEAARRIAEETSVKPLMLFSSNNMSEFLLTEKENRTFLRLMTSPVSARAYVMSNIAVNILVLLLQVSATLLFLRYVLHIGSAVPLGVLVLVLMLFGLCAVGLPLMIVSFSKSRAASGALENLIITPTCLLAGCFFPVDIMPGTVRKLSNFLPQHWVLDSVDKLQQGQAFGSLYLNIAILLAFTAAFSMIAVFRFGRNNDTRMFI